MNAIQTFFFDDLDIRGRYIRLDSEWQTWLANRHYTPSATELMGQCAAFIALVGNDVKHLGNFSLQMRGSSIIHTLFVQCHLHADHMTLRGMIDAPLLTDPSLIADALHDGDLALTLFNASTRTDYQSIVPIEGNAPSDIFAHYLTQSVQQPVILRLSATEQSLTGLLIEKMTDTDTKDDDGWNRIGHLVASMSDHELSTWTLAQLQHKLFHEETLSRFEPVAIHYHCPKNQARMAEVIKSLGREECLSILAEHGKIIISDDVCGYDYVFSEMDIQAIFEKMH